MNSDQLVQLLTRTPDLANLGPRDWEDVIGQARRAKLLGRLAARFQANGWLAELGVGPERHMESALRLADRQQHEVRWEVDCVRRALRDFQGPVVLLKGAAYVMAGLPPSKGRLFSDIDLMVPVELLSDVESALLAAGWASDERDAYNQRYYRQWMHEIPPLRHVHRDTCIDLHHTITPPTSRFRVAGEKLLKCIEPVDGHPKFHILAPPDMVLHSAVHLFQEGDFSHGFRDLLDLNDLLVHFSSREGFWNSLLNRAVELGLEVPLFHALFQIHRLIGASAPAIFRERVDALGPNAVARWAMASLLKLALVPDHPSCDSQWTGLARWLLYIRSHALRMPPYLVLPHLIRKAWMRRFPDEAS